MNSRSLWVWIGVALALGATILLRPYLTPKEPSSPMAVLPGLKASTVRTVLILPRGQPEIRLERTNNTWALVQPVNYPAQSALVDNLLTALERLAPASYIARGEIASRSRADEEYGFKDPLMRVELSATENASRRQFVVGTRTAPGDQVFLQVAGDPGVYVAAADFLKLLPGTPNDLRDTTFVRLKQLNYDRIAVTNGTRFFELERRTPGGSWRVARPTEARANQELIQSLAQSLEALSVTRFVTDHPSADLEYFGLQPASLDMSFKQGSTSVLRVRFGKTATNDVTQVYAIRGDQGGVVTVAGDALAGWSGSVNDFRDPHLLSLNEPVRLIEVLGENPFTVRQGTNGNWQLKDFAADGGLVTNLLQQLADMRIVEFTKDVVVTPVDLASYGLATPRRKFVLRSDSQPAPGTNAVRPLVELEFGTNTQDRVYVRRTDETSVYAVRASDVARLPGEALQLRERQIWSVVDDELAGITIRQGGKTRQINRKGRHEWALAPGSQGVINEIAVEESVRPLCQLRAETWVARGPSVRAEYGFSDAGLQLSLDLKSGAKLPIQFGNVVGTDSAYAAVTLDGEFWTFTLPPGVSRFIASYLTIPPELL